MLDVRLPRHSGPLAKADIRRRQKAGARIYRIFRLSQENRIGCPCRAVEIGGTKMGGSRPRLRPQGGVVGTRRLQGPVQRQLRTSQNRSWKWPMNHNLAVQSKDLRRQGWHIEERGGVSIVAQSWRTCGQKMAVSGNKPQMGGLCTSMNLLLLFVAECCLFSGGTHS